MREGLLRTWFTDSYDNKWGHFKPNQLFNVDQTPMPFVIRNAHMKKLRTTTRKRFGYRNQDPVLIKDNAQCK